jgi:ribonuclease Y
MLESFLLPLLEGIVAGVVVAGSSFFFYYRIQKKSARDLLSTARQESELLVSGASRKAEQAREAILKESREEGARLRTELDQEVRRRREEWERFERRVEEREKTLDKRAGQLESRERELTTQQTALEDRGRAIKERTEEAERLVAEQRTKLERVAGLTAEDARREVLQRAEDEARSAAAALARDIREQAKKSADRDAKRVVAMAIQRISAEHTAESTVAAVTLPSDEMKGRIIGREGRNIRAFETATGVDVIIDDTPDTVIISCFDPIRREIARRALAALIVDGRIHPGRIEELVVKAKKELEGEIQELGEQAAYDTGIAGLHGEMIRLIGRMKYRTSYGQNILEHSKEVAWLAGMMAAELKLDVMLAKRGALLHDVGKVLTYEHEGTHVELGVEMAKKYGESAAVINCIQAHHDDVPHESTESVLVQAADAISGSRPGARREAFESYVKRLTNLEEIATSYPGVEKANAIQAGREIRVVVTPDKIDDAQAALLSETIARRIEGELQYPGQIRVVVIRETRAVGLAK